MQKSRPRALVTCAPFFFNLSPTSSFAAIFALLIGLLRSGDRLLRDMRDLSEQLEVRAQFDAVEERFRALCASPACSAVALVLVPLAQVAGAAVDSGAKLLGRLCGRREIEFHQLEQDDDDY